MTINILIKLLDGVSMPERSTEGSAGFDLAAYEETYIYSDLTVRVKTGMYLEIPVGYVGLLIERSSLHKEGLSLANSVGVIDSDYRGEILIPVRNLTTHTTIIEKGQRLAQLIIMPIPAIRLISIGGINDTARGIGGFGSTGV